MGILWPQAFAKNLNAKRFWCLTSLVLLLYQDSISIGGQSIDIVQDEESAVFPHNEFEAIIGNMNLHWINNLEGKTHL